jgi:outer membrane protein OmpA-like peptidoglycan-associated protein
MANTDAVGNFSLVGLLPGGPYVISVSQPGYKAQMVNDIFLASGTPASFTFSLTQEEENLSGRLARKRAKAAESTGPVTGVPLNDPTALASTQPGLATTAPAPEPASLAAATSPHVSAAALESGSRSSSGRYYARRPAPKRAGAPVVPGHYDPSTGNYIYDTGAPVSLKLGASTISGIGVQSTENQLHRFLTDPRLEVDTVDRTHGWINFDRVFFTPNKATVTKESMAQLANIAAILKAHPQARVRLGGYTDSTGSYSLNRHLSEARARTAWAALVELGVAPGRLEARGYGPRYAVASNSTEAGRAQNRRLSLRVVAK